MIRTTLLTTLTLIALAAPTEASTGTTYAGYAYSYLTSAASEAHNAYDPKGYYLVDPQFDYHASQDAYSGYYYAYFAHQYLPNSTYATNACTYAYYAYYYAYYGYKNHNSTYEYYAYYYASKAATYSYYAAHGY